MEISNKKTLFHATSAPSKETHTLAWLDKFLLPGDVFFDVGANVGVFSLYAAAKSNLQTKVYSFEPEAMSFAQLSRNIYWNKFQGVIIPYCLALSDSSKLGQLFLEQFRVGGSVHQFDRQLDQHERQFKPAHVQGCHSITIDSIVENSAVQLPNHIKIDVDGLEEEVILGAQKTLANKTVKSVQIEISDIGGKAERVSKIFTDRGFVLANKDFEKELLDTRLRGDGSVCDYLFVRQ